MENQVIRRRTARKERPLQLNLEVFAQVVVRKGHGEASCWKLHPELKPSGSKGTKAGGKEKEIKTTGGEKKSWKAKFAELEAKMEAMSANISSGSGKPQVTPSFHAGGRFRPDDDDFEDYMLSGMALATTCGSREAFALTRSQTPASKEAL